MTWNRTYCILEKMHSLVLLMLLLLGLQWALLPEEHSSRVRCCMLYSTSKYVLDLKGTTPQFLSFFYCHFGGPSSVISYCALLNAVITVFPSIKTTLSHPVILKCSCQIPVCAKITAENIETIATMQYFKYFTNILLAYHKNTSRNMLRTLCVAMQHHPSLFFTCAIEILLFWVVLLEWGERPYCHYILTRCPCVLLSLCD